MTTTPHPFVLCREPHPMRSQGVAATCSLPTGHEGQHYGTDQMTGKETTWEATR